MKAKAWSDRLFVYINGELYRKTYINKSNDIYKAKNTRTGSVKTFSYGAVREIHEKAYNTREVSAMLGRSPRRIRAVIADGHIDTPQQTSYNKNKNTSPTALGDTVNVVRNGRCEYMFSKENLYEIRDYFASTRKAGSHHNAVPTKEELRAMIEQNVVLYIKAADGSFKPTWQAIEF